MHAITDQILRAQHLLRHYSTITNLKKFFIDWKSAPAEPSAPNFVLKKLSSTPSPFVLMISRSGLHPKCIWEGGNSVSFEGIDEKNHTVTFIYQWIPHTLGCASKKKWQLITNALAEMNCSNFTNPRDFYDQILTSAFLDPDDKKFHTLNSTLAALFVYSPACSGDGRKFNENVAKISAQECFSSDPEDGIRYDWRSVCEMDLLLMPLSPA